RVDQRVPRRAGVSSTSWERRPRRDGAVRYAQISTTRVVSPQRRKERKESALRSLFFFASFALKRRRRPLWKQNRRPGRLARLQAVEGGGKGILAHRIVDHRYAFTAGDFFHPVDEILPGVDDDVGAAVRFRERRFFVRAYRTDHVHAERVRPLARDEADTAG